MQRLERHQRGKRHLWPCDRVRVAERAVETRLAKDRQRREVVIVPHDVLQHSVIVASNIRRGNDFEWHAGIIPQRDEFAAFVVEKDPSILWSFARDPCNVLVAPRNHQFTAVAFRWWSRRHGHRWHGNEQQ